ncbi:MAG: LLM class flavin-dependent oxidoreductase [Candidatus Rokubacteria bacterium]|nr:LLM class flavin-dependent oxidoreductase [Candidatus Rokubacteria bacterium]
MSEAVRVHLRVPGTAPMPRLMHLVENIEAAGFDGVGILDSQLLARDTFVTLGQAAIHTSRLTLFPAVTNPFTRHASVLAGATATVEELAPGRVKFVIGTGYTSASTIGRKPATLAEIRACVGTVKTLLAGEPADFDGTRGRLPFASKRRIPVLMAASSRPRSSTSHGAPSAPGAGSTTSRSSGRSARGRRRPPRRRVDWHARPRFTGASCAGAATGSVRPASGCRSSTFPTRSTRSTRTSATRTIGKRRSPPRRSCPTTSWPSSARRWDSSGRRTIAPAGSSRWRSSASGTST